MINPTKFNVGDRIRCTYPDSGCNVFDRENRSIWDDAYKKLRASGKSYVVSKVTDNGNYYLIQLEGVSVPIGQRWWLAMFFSSSGNFTLEEFND